MAPSAASALPEAAAEAGERRERPAVAAPSASVRIRLELVEPERERDGLSDEDVLQLPPAAPGPFAGILGAHSLADGEAEDPPAAAAYRPSVNSLFPSAPAQGSGIAGLSSRSFALSDGRSSFAFADRPRPGPPSFSALVRNAAGTPARSVRALAAATPAAARDGWNNLRALLIMMSGPLVVMLPVLAVPFEAIGSHVARSCIFIFLATTGVGLNSGVWFAVSSEVPVQSILLPWVLSYSAIATVLFAAIDAGADLSSLPFGYLVGIACGIVSLQIVSRVYAVVLRRRRARAHPAPGPPPSPPTSPEPRGPTFDGAGIPALYSKYSKVKHALDALPFLYLFVFSLVRSPFLQILINFTATVASFSILALQVRFYGRTMYEALPHGDAVVLYVLGNLLNQRIFRQLSYFQVKSPVVYGASLAFELAALLFPASLLIDRVGRPALHRIRYLALIAKGRISWLFPGEAGARGRSARAERARSPQPARPGRAINSHERLLGPTAARLALAEARDDVSPRSPAHVRRRSVGGDSSEGPAARAAAASAAPVRSLTPEPDLSKAPPSLGGPRPASGGSHARLVVALNASPGGGVRSPGTPGSPLPPGLTAQEREDRELYSLQRGIRAVILLHAVVAWTSCLAFAVSLALARWGPGRSSWPFHPAVFPAEDCNTALQYAGITAAVHLVVVAGLELTGLAVPGLRERLGFAAAWRLLRERAFLLCALFAACGVLSLLGLFRYASIYSYAFPQAYAPTPSG